MSRFAITGHFRFIRKFRHATLLTQRLSHRSRCVSIASNGRRNFRGDRVTLRGRLTAAFLAVVLGPVLLGAFFVGTTVAAVDRSRSTERLALAAADRAYLGRRRSASSCAPPPTRSPRSTGRPGRPRAAQLVGRGLAAAVLVTDAAGRVSYATPGAPPAALAGLRRRRRPAGRGRSARSPSGSTLRDRGRRAARARSTAAQPVDPAFVARLAGGDRGGGHPARRRRGAARRHPHAPSP